MSQAQCAMINNHILKITLSPSLRNRRNKKKKIERKARNYRTLR